MSFDWKQLVKTVAPVLGTALGGPMAGAATKFIADKFLGNPNASEQEVVQAIQTATPDQLIKLKELDNDFKIEMRAYDSDDFKTETQGRANAYNREIEINKIPKDQRDNTLKHIAYLFIGCYFTILALIIAALWSQHVTKEEMEPIIQMQKDLGMAVMLILAYFYSASYKKD
jgi:hypothetical protein